MTQFHFVITAASPSGAVGTFDGVLDVPAGATRARLYQEVVQHVKSQMRDNRVNVLFFSLEPNELPVTG